MVVVEKEWSCLLMMPKSIIGKCRPSIWMLSTNNNSIRIPFRLVPGMHSFRVIPGTILAEFEFSLKFHRNHLINLAGPSAKFDSSGIPGIAWISPDSSRNQWRTIKTSDHPCLSLWTDIGIQWATTYYKKMDDSSAYVIVMCESRFEFIHYLIT